MFFLGDLPFLPHLKTDLAQMREIILKGRKTKKKANICTSVAKSRNGSSFQSLLCLFKHATLFDIIDFFGLISVLRPFNTFYVISGGPVTLTTLFLGKPSTQFTSTYCTFFHQ